jgi:hypothetical protein
VSSTYALVLFDGNASERLSAPSSFDGPNGVNNVLGGMAWNQLLFQQDYTDEGPHDITLVTLIADALNLDFFTIKTSQAYIPPVLSTGPRPVTASSGTATSAGTITATTSGKAGGSSPLLSSSGGVDHGAIIGGAVGGFAALFIAILLMLFCCRQRSHGARRFGLFKGKQRSGINDNGTFPFFVHV